MKFNTALVVVSILIAQFSGYVIGINHGYELGADTMQCVTYNALDLKDKSLEKVACSSLSRWEHHPSFIIRKLYIYMTGQGVPDHFTPRKPGSM